MPKHKHLKTESGLTRQQELFCHEFLKDLNARQSAIRAGYSEKTAQEQASRLLSNVKVQHLIDKLNQERLERTKIDADFVLKEHARLATSDVAECFDEDGNMKPIKDMPRNVRLAISSFDIEERVERDRDTGEELCTVITKKVRLWNKDKNLENLGRHLALYTDKKEISGSVELADRMKKARERARN